MVFEIFVLCVRDKQEAKYDRRIAEEISNRDAIDPSTPLSFIRYSG